MGPLGLNFGLLWEKITYWTGPKDTFHYSIHLLNHSQMKWDFQIIDWELKKDLKTRKISPILLKYPTCKCTWFENIFMAKKTKQKLHFLYNV